VVLSIPLRRLVVTALSAGFLLLSITASHVSAQSDEETFASQIARFSEPSGFFDTDNLISNERTYLHVIDKLKHLSLSGGIYLGVGPDQNFSYIAQLQPERAYIIDIRRDNLLIHFLFKALFEISPTRVEYVANLFGRPVPDDTSHWETADIDQVVDFVDETTLDNGQLLLVQQRINQQLREFGVQLSMTDDETIARFHQIFANRGLSLQFRSLGRPPRPHYPTYRDIILATDSRGVPSSYLASRTTYQFVRQLQLKDRIIPIVGNFAGSHAIKTLGDYLSSEGKSVSAFYTSNVEFYLFQNRLFSRYLNNLSRLPYKKNSVIIRSVFNQRRGFPANNAQSYSSAVVQDFRDFVTGFESGKYRSYWDLAPK